MAAGQFSDNSADGQSMSVPTDLTPGLYDGTSSESSASSPMNCNNVSSDNLLCGTLRGDCTNMDWKGFDNFYGGSGFMPYPAFPMQYPMNGENLAPVGLIPVELEIEGLYEDYDRRRRKNGSEKIVSSHVHSVGVQSHRFFAKACQLMQRRGGELKTEVRQLFLISAGKDVELNN